MKKILILLGGLFSKTVKLKQQNEINCDLSQLSIPRNANGWICQAAENGLSDIVWCNLDCFVEFQIKPGLLSIWNCWYKKIFSVSERNFHICNKTSDWVEPHNVVLECVSKSKLAFLLNGICLRNITNTFRLWWESTTFNRRRSITGYVWTWHQPKTWSRCASGRYNCKWK